MQFLFHLCFSVLTVVFHLSDTRFVPRGGGGGFVFTASGGWRVSSFSFSTIPMPIRTICNNTYSYSPSSNDQRNPNQRAQATRAAVVSVAVVPPAATPAVVDVPCKKTGKLAFANIVRWFIFTLSPPLPPELRPPPRPPPPLASASPSRRRRAANARRNPRRAKNRRIFVLFLRTQEPDLLRDANYHSRSFPFPPSD